VVPDLANPFFLEVVRGVERVATEEGYAVLLCDGQALPVARHLETLRTRQVDGVILDARGAAAVPDEAVAGLNVVLIEEPSERWPWVASDALLAGRLAAEHLLALGHRALAFIGPAEALHAFRMRERGFVGVLAEAGLALPTEWLRRAPPTVEGGQTAMRALLGGARRPSAVFCANDLVALGALKACLSAGVRVPEDLSLMGCDDIEMARIVTPELSTVAVPAREIGARAARLLVQRLEGKPPPRGAVRPLPVRAVIRRTTGPVPAAPEA
jgi:DNA-binding LacI/PurR family transcriptional regulator